MAGRADERHVRACLAGDGVDDAKRQIEVFEHRPLLDVELEIAERFRRRTRVGDPAGIETEVAGSRREACGPPASRAIEQPASNVPASARLPMNGTPKRTPSSSEKPTTSMANGRRFASSRSTSAIAEHHAEDAVERAGVRHRVEMRADEQAGTSRRRRRTAPADTRRECSRWHPRAPSCPAAPSTRRAPYGRRASAAKERSASCAVRSSRQLRQLPAPANRLRGPVRSSDHDPR